MAGGRDHRRHLRGGGVEHVPRAAELIVAAQLDVDARLAELLGAHDAVKAAEAAADAARAHRDALVAQALDDGITAYRIAKTLGVAQTTPQVMAKAAAKRIAAS